MRKGDERGIFFCAKVGERTYLRFVHATDEWKLKYGEVENGSELEPAALIDRELGRCLRLIECTENTEIELNEIAQDAAYDLWLTAREDIHKGWMHETDPANLQPRIRPLNRKVADFIRNNTPIDIEQDRIERALDIVESPWGRRDEDRLRRWFEIEEAGAKKSGHVINKILDSGLDPFQAPKTLPPIGQDEIELLVWMVITN